MFHSAKMNKYQILHACGEGFYGTVFKSRHKQSDTMVAIKQFKQKEDYATKREIETLQSLKHANIINLREVFREQGKLHMVFEFLDTDLLNALGKYPKGMPEKLVRCYMLQLCKALEFCHQRGVVHRDLKPENLLVAGDVARPDPKRSLKLCDFGEARHVGPADKLLSGIIGTRWYRAPEILIGAKVASSVKANDASGFNKVTRPKLLRYDFQVDMWGVGCIMGELLTANPMFPADTDIQQLEMVQVYGTPAQLTRRFDGKCSANCASALKGLMELSPHKRLTARSAMQHQFFSTGRKGKLVDSYSVNNKGSRKKFEPNFSSMNEMDEDIATESDNDDEEVLSECSDMPEDDFEAYEDDGDDYDTQPAEVKQQEHPHHHDDDYEAEEEGNGYSDDEFEDEGYSDDEFEAHEDEEKEQKEQKTSAEGKHDAPHTPEKPPEKRRRVKPASAEKKTKKKPASNQGKRLSNNNRSSSSSSNNSSATKTKAATKPPRVPSANPAKSNSKSSRASSRASHKPAPGKGASGRGSSRASQRSQRSAATAPKKAVKHKRSASNGKTHTKEAAASGSRNHKKSGHSSSKSTSGAKTTETKGSSKKVESKASSKHKKSDSTSKSKHTSSKASKEDSAKSSKASKSKKSKSNATEVAAKGSKKSKTSSKSAKSHESSKKSSKSRSRGK